MTDTPFIVAGWVGTAGAIGLYALTVAVRTRRAVSRRSR